MTAADRVIIDDLRARLSAVEQERDEAEANGETAMVQRDLAMGKLAAAEARAEAAEQALLAAAKKLETHAHFLEPDSFVAEIHSDITAALASREEQGGG